MTVGQTVFAALDARLGTNAGEKTAVAVAVSGGSDSTALLTLAYDWADARGARLEAVTVDHGLRASAKAEIAQVAALCARLGCAHSVLTWDGWDGQGNLQAQARAARYSLMTKWALDRRIHAVLLGHTADDQAETVLLRLARGSGVDGLAAMQEATLRNEICWLRPLLTQRREALRDMLRARDIPWSDDPSNDDTGFDRIKLRQAMPVLAEIGLDVARLTQTAAHMRRAREALEASVTALAERVVSQEAGDVLIASGEFDTAPDELRTRLVAAALSFVSGQPYRPRFDALGAVIADGGTLHGCLVTRSRTGLRITREAAALRGVQSAPGVVFDGRWQITGPALADARVSALGSSGLKLLDDWRTSGLPRATLSASPAIWRAEQLIAAPLAGHNPAWNAQLTLNRADFLAYLRCT